MKAGRKRITLNLSQRRQFVSDLKMDEFKLAVLQAKDPIRPRRDMLYEYYDLAVEGDGHFIGEYEKAIAKVVGSPFAVFKKGTDTIDELATRLLTKNWFEEYRWYHEEGDVFYGHSLVQFLDLVPSEEKGITYEFRELELIPRFHVRPEEGFIVLDVSDEKGIPFRDPSIKKALKLIEMGKPKSLGKLKIIVREYIWKNYSRTDWSRHSEKFGMPMVAIKTAATDDKELDNLEKMAREFGNNLWMILDEEDDVELKEPTFKDSFNIYKEKVLLCNDEMSKATTWQTGTSDEKAYVGSSEVHADILDDYTEWRKRKQTYHINDVLFPFLRENGYPLDGLEFRYLSYKETNPEEDDAEQNKRTGNKEKDSGGSPAKKSNQKALFKYRIT